MKVLIIKQNGKITVSLTDEKRRPGAEEMGRTFRRLSHRAWGYIRREMRKETE